MLSLTYLSTATEALDEPALFDVLTHSRAHNASCDVTGLLLYRDGNIIQTIEGPPDAVEATFDRIRRDPRHRGVIVLLREELPERAFPDWAMGFRSVSVRPEDVAGYRPDLARPELDAADSSRSSHSSSARHLHSTFRASMR